MAAATVESGVYFIQNYGSGTVVDLKDGSIANGTKTQGYAKRELSDKWVPPQLWIISQVESGAMYTIQNAVGAFLTLRGSANESPIEGFAADNSDNQKWVINRANNGISYVIHNKATGTYVDLFNGGSSNGTAINGWAGCGVGTTNPHQLWLIVRA